MRIGRPWKAAALLAVGAAGGGAAFAVASVPGSDGVIHACVSVQTVAGPNGQLVVPAAGPNLRVIDTAHQQCAASVAGVPNTETALDWNQTGPQGVPGQAGPAGKTATVVSGHTLTLAGGGVITIGGQSAATGTVTFPNPPTRPSGNVLTLTLDKGAPLDILSFGFASTATGAHGSGGGGGAGKVTVHDLTITRKVDKASAALALACANGKHIQSAIIVVRKAGGKSLVYTLSNVLISSYQSGGHGQGTAPNETLTLNFTKIGIKYTAQHS